MTNKVVTNKIVTKKVVTDKSPFFVIGSFDIP